MVKFITAFLLIITFQIGNTQSNYLSKKQLKKSVEAFEESIAAKNIADFEDLFVSKEVSFTGVMSKETELAKDGNPGYESISVSDSKSFISTIAKSKKKYEMKTFDVEANADGRVGNVGFNYAFYSGTTMKQWGHEKWNMILSEGEWLITNVVYSVHFPNIEKCPFATSDGNEYESISDSEESAESYEPKIKVRPKPRREKEYADVAEEEEDYEEEEVEEEEVEEVKPKPTKSKKTLSVKVNQRRKGALYAGIENKVEINYKDLPNSKITIHCSTPDVEYHKKESGMFSIKPLGMMDDFTINIRAGNRTLKYTFQVEAMPNPRPLLSKRYSGPVKAKEFQGHMGILASTKDFPFRAKCVITRFTVTRKGKDGTNKTVSNKGGRFQDNTQLLVRKAKRGDQYFFEKISCQCPGDRKIRQLDDLEFKIK